MKAFQAIPEPVKSKKPFIQNGRKDLFIKRNNAVNKIEPQRLNKEENKAEKFARNAISNQHVVQAFKQNPIANQNLQKPSFNKAAGYVSWNSQPLPKKLVETFKSQLNEDFTDVQIHCDKLSSEIAKKYNAAALTSGNHIFLNSDVFETNTENGLYLLAHELYHTLHKADSQHHIEIQLKPLTELNDRSPEQTMALERAVKIAQGEKGKVNSGALNDDKTRVG
jgi:hypothetical protein